MFEVELLCLDTRKTFTKFFDSEYFFRKFINKCKYSKKVKVLSWFKY